MGSVEVMVMRVEVEGRRSRLRVYVLARARVHGLHSLCWWYCPLYITCT